MTQDYYQQGLAKAKAGDDRGAIAEFDLALIATPEWAELYYRRGLAYFDLGEVLSAVSDYTQATAFDPQHRDSHYARALARLTLKNFPGALSDIDRAIIYGRDYAPAYQLKGLVCRKLTQYTEAIAAYKMAANLYLAQKDPEQSRQCLELAQSLQPKPMPIAPSSTLAPLPQMSVEQYYTQLLKRADRGELVGAIDDVDWAVRTSPNDARSYICRGILRLKQGNKPAALADFTQAISIDPQSHVAYCNRGKLRSQMGDSGGAILDFDRALAIDDRDLFIYLARGNVRVSANDYVGAIADFDRAISIDPTEPKAYVERAQAYTKQEELRQAIADYQLAANLYLERQDFVKYRDTLAQLQKIQRAAPLSAPPPLPKSNPQMEALRQRLLRLVGGHWAIAARAIEHLEEQYPGQSEEWYLQTVIHNLEEGL
jgi:tetratricopeptide (TPR) repeat protein